jgi:flagellar L-ring protein precursor FlgH
MIHYCILAPEAAPATPLRAISFLGSAKSAMLGALSAVALLATIAASLSAQPPVTAAPAGARTAADTTAPARRNFNWLGDKRAFGVGDILKVNVDEYTLASANKGTTSDAARERKMGVDIAPPSMGASALGPISGSVGSGDAGRSHQNGVASNSTRYVGELSVRVIAVTKEGLLQVRGSKLIDVDKNKQEMTLTGFIRPQDVNSQDMVLSTSMADVQLAYKSKGALGKPKSGIITKIVGIFWP